MLWAGAGAAAAQNVAIQTVAVRTHSADRSAMAAMNEEAIQMAVDYLLSADGTSPIEVQLSFLKSRMKMAPHEIAEALRLTGLDGSEAMAPGPQPATSATIVREAEQAQQATQELTAASVKIAEVTTEPPRATTQPQALSTQSATHGYMANAFPQQPSLVVGYRGSHGRAPLSAPHPTVDTRHFTKPITGAPAPERVVVTSVGGAPPVKHAQGPNFQPQFTVGTSSRASMNNSRKSTQWADDGKNAVGAIMGLGSAFDEGGKENGAGVANKRRPASGRRAGQAYGSWTKNELRSSMNLGNAGAGARRKTASQKMFETAPMDSGSYSGSGGYGRQGKFSQEQSLFRPRPDLVQYNVSPTAPYHVQHRDFLMGVNHAAFRTWASTMKLAWTLPRTALPTAKATRRRGPLADRLQRIRLRQMPSTRVGTMRRQCTSRHRRFLIVAAVGSTIVQQMPPKAEANEQVVPSACALQFSFHSEMVALGN